MVREVKIEDLEYIELDVAPTATALNNSTLEDFQGSGEIVVNSIGNNHVTNGMMEYLYLAYNYHKGIYITHEHIWLIILSEIATIVKKSPSEYSSIFTDSDDVKEIMVEGAGFELPMDKIHDALMELIPSNVSVFFPEFTVFDSKYTKAASIAFADIVSPYYSYSMYMCGIPSVKILGEESDWNNILQSIISIKELLDTTEMTAYLETVYNTVNILAFNNESDVWKEMFYVEKCGSGGQVEVCGWFADMYNITPSVKYTHNYPTGISSIKYTNLLTKQKLKMYSGLMSCSITKDDYLCPNIDTVIVLEKNDRED